MRVSLLMENRMAPWGPESCQVLHWAGGGTLAVSGASGLSLGRKQALGREEFGHTVPRFPRGRKESRPPKAPATDMVKCPFRKEDQRLRCSGVWCRPLLLTCGWAHSFCQRLGKPFVSGIQSLLWTHGCDFSFLTFGTSHLSLWVPGF